MKLTLPAGVAAQSFERALRSFERIVGPQWVLATDEDRRTYLDAYAPGDAESYGPSAAVAPLTVEEIQAILRVANEHKLPLWPFSRGKNLGYGGSAPCLRGSVILDLSRMKKILEVDEKLAYCLVEPGVGFFDLFDHLQSNGIKLWMSIPANGWGSVIGNALDRGLSYTPYGEHSKRVCGMEVVLPNGDIVRTGLGAMKNSRSWQLSQNAFGPSWDQMFMQSNFGVVTKMGLWLMPEPEATLSISTSLPNPDDIEWIIDTLAPLRLRGVIQHDANVGNGIRAATQRSQRDEWYRGSGAMPQSVIDEMQKKLGLGEWNFTLRFYGHPEHNEISARIVKESIAKHADVEFREARWHRGEPLTRDSGAGIPSVNALQVVNWRGGRGGHIGFSPISPASGEHALKQYRLARRRYEEHGFDYFGSFTIRERHLNHVTLCVYDRDDAEMTKNARALMDVLIKDAAADGYGEYRAHVMYMDQIARTYDFNDRALWRLNETIKDALDPNGILAPGKSGIWPKSMRGART
jgi:4-cresol dehydrogenase (hydroxylating)